MLPMIPLGIWYVARERRTMVITDNWFRKGMQCVSNSVVAIHRMESGLNAAQTTFILKDFTFL